MQFLLTNDDGIEAPGLELLEEVLSAHGSVMVVAPVEEQSGVGHRVTTRGELTLTSCGEQRFALSGTPADCARVALRVLNTGADWVLSGLNHGGNLGVDIHMSGTVAGAREAAIWRRQAIAISQVINVKHPPDRARIQALTVHVVSFLLSRPLPEGQFYNVNLPFSPESEQPELVFCPPDPSPHDVRYSRDSASLRYAGVFLDRGRVPGSDVDVLLRGKVSISVLSIV
jgi:5'-nucleotidase